MADSSSEESEPDSCNPPRIEEWERHRVLSYKRPVIGIVAVVGTVVSYAFTSP